MKWHHAKPSSPLFLKMDWNTNTMELKQPKHALKYILHIFCHMTAAFVNNLKV